MSALIALLVLTACQRVNYESFMLDQAMTRGRELPRITINPEASSVQLTYLDRNNREIPDQKSIFSKLEVLSGIEAYWNYLAVTTLAWPTTVRITGEVQKGYLPLLQIWALGIPFLFGSPAAMAEASVEVHITVGEEVFSDEGYGYCVAGMYYPQDPSQCAMAKATAAAIRKAVRRHKL